MSYLFASFFSSIPAKELLEKLKGETSYLGFFSEIAMEVAYGRDIKRFVELKIINNVVCLKATYINNNDFLFKDDTRKMFAKIEKDVDSIIEQVSTIIKLFERSKKITS